VRLCPGGADTGQRGKRILSAGRWQGWDVAIAKKRRLQSDGTSEANFGKPTKNFRRIKSA